LRGVRQVEEASAESCAADCRDAWNARVAHVRADLEAQGAARTA
jgi:hypothetical protein